MVIYGKVGTDKNGQAKSAKCIHGGAAFIVPIIQSFQYLDLTPISINVDLKNALSKILTGVSLAYSTVPVLFGNTFFSVVNSLVPSRFTVGISTEPGIMQNAAERLLGLKMMEIQELAKDIIQQSRFQDFPYFIASKNKILCKNNYVRFLPFLKDDLIKKLSSITSNRMPNISQKNSIKNSIKLCPFNY